jgi:hypothetical protein
MASPHRFKSFSYDGGRSTSPPILLVSTGDGDSYKVVLGPILTLMRSEEASPELEDLLAIEPAGLEAASIEIGLPYASVPTDESGDAVKPEPGDNWVEDMTEQATTSYDYELEEGWLEEQLLDSLDADILASESPVKIHDSPGMPHFPYYLVGAFPFIAFTPLFYFVAELSTPTGPPEVADVPASIPVSSVSADEIPGYILSSFIFSFYRSSSPDMLLLYCRFHIRGRETRLDGAGRLTLGHLLPGLPTGSRDLGLLAIGCLL